MKRKEILGGRESPRQQSTKEAVRRESFESKKSHCTRYICFIDVCDYFALDVLVHMHFMVWAIKCMYAFTTKVICSKKKCQGKDNGVFIMYY